MKKTIDVIIPVYNQEKYLERCLDSIVSQNLENVYLILVNDGSTDCSPQICKVYEDKYPDHITVVHKENGGLASARNAGLAVAKSDYITFVDSDDVLEEKYLDTLHFLIGEDLLSKTLFVFSHQIKHIDFGTRQIVLKNQVFDTRNGVLYLEKEGTFNFSWNKIYDRKILTENQIRFELNSEPGEDLLFNCKYFKCIDRIVTSDQVLYSYMRNGEDSQANKFRPDLWEKNKRFISAIEDLFETNGMKSPEEQALLADACIAYVHSNIPNMYRKKHRFPKKQRIGFYREILENKTIESYFSILHSERKMIEKLRKLYLTHSPARLDRYYSLAMFVRNNFSGIYKLIRKKVIKS